MLWYCLDLREEREFRMKVDSLMYERVKELFDYDGETGLLIRKTFRNGCPYNKPVGYKPNSSTGYGMVGIDGKYYLTHRIIWLLVHGSWPENEIDHIDRNPLNNKIENLRAATQSENMHNCEMNRNNTSGYPGVCFHKQAKKYKADIRINNKNVYLGLYPTPEEAAVAYMIAKIEHHPTSPIAKEYLRELTLAG